MVPVTQWLTQPWTHDLIMTLGHSLWQGLLLSALLYGLLNSRRSTQPQTRYLAGAGALLALLLCLFATFALLQLERPEPVLISTPDSSVQAETSGDVDSADTPHVRVQTSVPVPWHTWALYAWATGACIMLIRMVSLLFGVHTLTRRSVPVTDRVILDRIDSVRTKLRISRQILVVMGEHILSPGVIGFFRPILLLPMSLATGVPTEDLEAILIHELAHIRRYDYGVNFVQMVIEALLFFNPTVWWINRQIRLEREACCDTVAVTFSGQRVRYAELLMQWSQPNQVAAMASFSTRKHASLAERVKRIVLPHHTPRIHLSLLSILGMFLLTALLLAALWKTTDTAVVLAAKILTPAQRADTIDQIDRSYGAQAVQKRPEDRVTIEGSVRAADGSALPNDFYIRILGQNSTGETSSGTRVKNGKFRHTMDDYYETLYLLVERLDFATAYVGPFDAERGETIDNIDVVLTHGFPGVIEVVDKKGDPIEGAAINGSYEVFERSWRGAQYLQDVISDEQGRIVIEKAITRPMKVDIWAKGYQYTCDIPCTLTPEKPTRLSLKRALPTTGTIVDTRTGSAVPNASIRIWRDHSSRHNYREYGTIWGTSDQEGRFGLTTLTKDHTYTFLIETPDHQYTRLKDVHMGDRNLLVQLDPKRHIRGVVLGQPPVEPVYNSHSRTWSKNGPVLKFMSGFEDEYSFHSSNTQLTEANGRFEFDISDVYGDTIEIKTGDKRARLKFGNGDVEDLVIDLRPLTERHQDSDEMRAVVLQFNPPEGIDCNDFQVTVSAVSQKDREAGHWGQWIKYTIQDNQIRLAVPTPGLISYGRGSLDPSRDKGTYIRPLWIEGKHQIPVSGDESPFMIDVPLHPAGTIYGQIHVPEQKHLTRSSQDVDIQLLALDTPDYMTSLGFNREIPFNGYWRPTDRYSIAPVPLGGTYVVVAQYQFGWIKSNPIDLKEGQSIAQCDLVFPRGVDVTGTVTSGRNQPLASVSVSLQFTTKIGNRPWSTAHHVIRTDHQGRFVFAGVNPEIKGTYLLRVESPKDYAPVTDIKIKPRQRPYVIKLKPSIR